MKEQQQQQQQQRQKGETLSSHYLTHKMNG